MKYFLLIVGHNYYPEAGSGDWVRTYDTYEEALEEVNNMEDTWGDPLTKSTCNWFRIIDLRDWL